ncbi:hypothetical protein GE09DRAFT_1047953 [Coniochaeta sp. 2T2.1]|nr:hypothetical protein GE09DRAFT_1047953 [Coniochaeta sp. 2T2.1]
MATTTNSAEVNKRVIREPDSTNFELTSDVIASRLHEHIVGRTVIITGISANGLGAHAAEVIAKHSPKFLILASRRVSAITPIAELIKRTTTNSGVQVVPLELDLASQSSVRKAAAAVLKLTTVVDVLINNAGVMMLQEYITSPEGIESHLAINHVGHFLFTNLVMPALFKSSQPRVVNVTSAASIASPFRFDDMGFGNGKEYDPFLAYAHTKTANLLFTLGLARQLGEKALVAIGVDPGGVHGTGIDRAIPISIQIERGWRLKDGSWNPEIPYKTPAQAVASYIIAAFGPDVKGEASFTLTAGVFDATLAPHAKDPEAADKLWTVSEKLVGQEFRY